VTINPFDILKNAQKLQDQMAALQNKLAGVVITGSSGGGMVEIDLNGRMEALAVRIAAEAMEDREMLQDLVKAAFSSALEKVQEQSGREMGALASGLGISPVSGPAGQ
jgi:DNA-binding YbaB/EbfC family protein